MTATNTNNKISSSEEQIQTANQIARGYIGGVAWPTLILICLAWFGFGLTIAAWCTGIIATSMAVFFVAVFTYFSYTPLHEAVHGNVQGREHKLRWLNDVCGYLGAQLIGVSFTSHRFEHFDHHRNTNQPDKDPDFIVRNLKKGPVSAVFTALQFLYLQNSYLARMYWSKITVKQKLVYCIELISILAWRVLLIVLLTANSSISVTSALLVVFVAYYIGAFFTVYWFAYRPHHPYQNHERFANTSSLVFPRYLKFMEWFWLGQNLHSVHHLYPRIPFYRYAACHLEIETVLRANGTPIIGIFSRRPV